MESHSTACFHIAFLALLCTIFAYIPATNGSHHNFVDHISINCGSAESYPEAWLEDDNYPKKLATSLIKLRGSSSTRTADVDSVPYDTARISRSKFSYTFRLDPGEKYIRLHFNPASYHGFEKFRDLFNVEANRFTLLSNFSPSITAKHLGVSTFVKEFCITTQENQPLDIVISRSIDATQSSKDNYAFVNGIEIISIPAGSPYCHSGDNGVQVVDQKYVVHVDNNTALEMVHRYHLKKGYSVLPFHRIWNTHLTERENIWKVSVDVGFRYIVKLHFCELGHNAVQTSHDNFMILINHVIACTYADIFQERKEEGVLWHKNYMVIVQGSKKEGKRDILISMDSEDGDIPLEGFEVFKLSNHDYSLASPNPLSLSTYFVSQPIANIQSLFYWMKGTVTYIVPILCFINIIVYELRLIWGTNNFSEEEKKLPTTDKQLCRCFSLTEIKSATKNFSDTLIIGKGGFGNVYKGLIDDGNQTVAIKRLRPDSRQGKREFWTEIEMLSELRHVNLVSLIGYCNDEGEMILVYEHMPRGTLADYLYKLVGKISIRSSLSWRQRLIICIGAGRGLDYLHTGHRVIHRDVKSSNILLDETFLAKFSDFGLAKTQIGRDSQTQDSTNLKGTFGYMDPDYFRTRTITRKSDTYSFGVVLLEVLCGRKAVDRALEDDKRSLTTWARDNISKGDLDTIIDPRLRGQISPGSLKAFLNIAEKCLDDVPKKRPRMAHVVMNLEFALELQDNVNLSIENGINNNSVDIFPCVCKIQQELTKTLVPNEKTSVSGFLPSIVRTLLSGKSSSNTLNVTAPQISAISQVISSAPQEKNGRKISKLKLSQFLPFDSFRSKIKPSKDFAGISVSAPISRRTSKEPPSRVDGASRKQSAVIGNELLTTPDLKVFSFSELRKATQNFDTMLGEGGFGRVYKGWVHSKKDKTRTVVAIKKLSPESMQGFKEWQAEVTFLGRLSHPNLVKLLGYCCENEQQLLVYEFMKKGSLENRLFRCVGSVQTLSWDMRLKILLGAAHGLSFLHGNKIIYRDVKSSNILLDESYNAKLSDFGLAKSGPTACETHVTTRVMGTYGYAAPEYIATGHLTVKSDIYGFGVCVMEMLTGRRVVEMKLPSEQQNLVEWVKRMENKHKLKTLIDPSLEGNYPVTAALRIAQLGLDCVEYEPKRRPSMIEVIEILERADLGIEKNKQPRVRFMNQVEVA